MRGEAALQGFAGPWQRDVRTVRVVLEAPGARKRRDLPPVCAEGEVQARQTANKPAFQTPDDQVQTMAST